MDIRMPKTRSNHPSIAFGQVKFVTQRFKESAHRAADAPPASQSDKSNSLANGINEKLSLFRPDTEGEDATPPSKVNFPSLLGIFSFSLFFFMAFMLFFRYLTNIRREKAKKKRKRNRLKQGKSAMEGSAVAISKQVFQCHDEIHPLVKEALCPEAGSNKDQGKSTNKRPPLSKDQSIFSADSLASVDNIAIDVIHDSLHDLVREELEGPTEKMYSIMMENERLNSTTSGQTPNNLLLKRPPIPPRHRASIATSPVPKFTIGVDDNEPLVPDESATAKRRLFTRHASMEKGSASLSPTWSPGNSSNPSRLTLSDRCCDSDCELINRLPVLTQAMRSHSAVNTSSLNMNPPSSSETPHYFYRYGTSLKVPNRRPSDDIYSEKYQQFLEERRKRQRMLDERKKRRLRLQSQRSVNSTDSTYGYRRRLSRMASYSSNGEDPETMIESEGKTRMFLNAMRVNLPKSLF